MHSKTGDLKSSLMPSKGEYSEQITMNFSNRSEIKQIQ
jgi:hypothetical protein